MPDAGNSIAPPGYQPPPPGAPAPATAGAAPSQGGMNPFLAAAGFRFNPDGSVSHEDDAAPSQGATPATAPPRASLTVSAPAPDQPAPVSPAGQNPSVAPSGADQPSPNATPFTPGPQPVHGVVQELRNQRWYQPVLDTLNHITTATNGIDSALAHGTTFGLNEIVGPVIPALTRSLQTGEPFQKAYDAELAAMRKPRTDFEEQHPAAGMAVETLGSLPGGAAMSPLFAAGKAGATFGQGALRAARNVAAAAGTGAATGFTMTDGDTAQRLEGAKLGAVASTALGVAAPAAVNAVTGAGKVLFNRAGQVEGVAGRMLNEAAGDQVPNMERAQIPNVPLNAGQASGNAGLASMVDKQDAANVPAMKLEQAQQNQGVTGALTGKAPGEPVLSSGQSAADASVQTVGAIKDSADVIAGEEKRVWNTKALTRKSIGSEGIQGYVATGIKKLAEEDRTLADIIKYTPSIGRALVRLDGFSGDVSAQDINGISSALRRIQRQWTLDGDVRIAAGKLAQLTQDALYNAPEVVGSGRFGPGAAAAGQGALPLSAPAAAASAGPAAPTAGPAAPTIGNRVWLGKQAHNVQYKVVDADSLLASHKMDMSVNPEFPEAYQPRDRDRIAYEKQVHDISTGLNPEQVGASASGAEGAPIVYGPNNTVIVGNGRAIGLQRALENDGPQAAAYRKFLEDHGFDLSGIKKPVLVREITDDMSHDDLARAAQSGNLQPGMSYSAPEQAKIDARSLDDRTMSLWRGGDINSKTNRDFVRAYSQHVLGPGEDGAFRGADGQLSTSGKNRIQNALLHKAYGDAELTGRLLDSEEPELKAFGHGLREASGDMASLANDVAEGRIPPKMDIGKDVAEAARIVAKARAKGDSVADVLNQGSLLGGGPSILTKEILKSAYGEDLAGRFSRSRFTTAMRDFAAEAKNQATGSLLSEGLTPEQIMAKVEAKRSGKQFNDEASSPDVGDNNGQGGGKTGPQVQRPGDAAPGAEGAGQSTQGPDGKRAAVAGGLEGQAVGAPATAAQPLPSAPPDIPPDPDLVRDLKAARAFTKREAETLGHASFENILNRNSSGNETATPGTAMNRFFDFGNGVERPGAIKNVSKFLDDIRSEWLKLNAAAGNQDFNVAHINAVKGELENGARDFIIAKLLGKASGTALDANGNNQLQYTQLTKWLETNRSMIERTGMFDKNQLNLLDRITETSKLIQRGNSLGRGTGSPTYTRFMSGGVRYLDVFLSSFNRHVVGGALGAGVGYAVGSLLGHEAIGALVGAAGEAGGIGARILDSLYSAPRQLLVQKLDEAMRNPDIARDLMMRAKSGSRVSAPTRQWMRSFLSTEPTAQAARTLGPPAQQQEQGQ